jgi:hypothetical protein
MIGLIPHAAGGQPDEVEVAAFVVELDNIAALTGEDAEAEAFVLQDDEAHAEVFDLVNTRSPVSLWPVAIERHEALRMVRWTGCRTSRRHDTDDANGCQRDAREVS